jgi:protein-S-isoprenylcysteine O-methyltransferase Ste14
MSLGMDATLAAATFYPMNPFVLVMRVFIAAVHHKIIPVEEARLLVIFGEAFGDYCRKVRR